MTVQLCFLTVFLSFYFNPFQTRNARKACPNDVSLPDWILTSRERGGSLKFSN